MQYNRLIAYLIFMSNNWTYTCIIELYCLRDFFYLKINSDKVYGYIFFPQVLYFCIIQNNLDELISWMIHFTSSLNQPD